MYIKLNRIFDKTIKLILYYPFIYFLLEVVRDFTMINLLPLINILLMILLLLNFKSIKNKILIIILVILMGIHKIINPNMNSLAMMYRFIIVILIASLFTSELAVDRFKYFINLKYKNLKFYYNCTILTVVLYLLNPQGYINKWGGNNYFIGPFDNAHEFGYFLLILLAINIYIENILKRTNKIALSILIIVIQLLTGARIPLLASILLFINPTLNYLKYKKRQTLMVLIFSTVVIVFLFKLDIVQHIPFIEKMLYTTGKESLSSGRDIIWSGNLSAFKESYIQNKLFGSGMNFSFYVNSITLNNPIWSHNDFIHILLAYGVVGVAIYIYILLNLFIKNKSLFIFIIVFILGVMNGLFTYYHFCIMIPFIIIDDIKFLTPK